MYLVWRHCKPKARRRPRISTSVLVLDQAILASFRLNFSTIVLHIRHFWILPMAGIGETADKLDIAMSLAMGDPSLAKRTVMISRRVFTVPKRLARAAPRKDIAFCHPSALATLRNASVACQRHRILPHCDTTPLAIRYQPRLPERRFLHMHFLFYNTNDLTIKNNNLYQ
ncbi:hypothetical protein [Chromobacterium vaccinii]|uniref:hypothetical protein n=1 Tax=Chromobacterium vaccinii TaxID=1108595 RepID=UPI0011AB7315|nr:hypothetical protein [Chromobacterium vaccinii]